MALSEEQKQRLREQMRGSAPTATPSSSYSSRDEILKKLQESIIQDEAKQRLQENARKQVEQKKGGFLAGVGKFVGGAVKSFGDTAMRTAVQSNPLTRTLSPLLPEKADLPIVGETSLRYSDDTKQALGEGVEDAVNIIPGGAVRKPALKLAEEGAEGFAGKLIKSAFRITDNDLKKKPTLIKDFLIERISGTKRGIAKKADATVDALESQLDEAISTASKTGSSLNAKDLAKNTEPLVSYYENSAFPEYAQVVKNKVAEFVKRGEIPLKEAQEFKRNTYRIIRETGFGQMMGPDKETAKQIARGVREGIETALPDFKIADINKKLAIYGKARDLMERQLNRMGPNQLVPFKDIVLTGTTGSLVPTLVRMVVESTPFKTFVARALTSTKTQTIKNTTKFSAPVLKEVFRYGSQE